MSSPECLAQRASAFAVHNATNVRAVVLSSCPCRAHRMSSINMLCGFFEPTEGEALVDGKDIRTEMADIYPVR